MATKTFSHAVIWDGKFIPANTPIEVKETVFEKKTVVDETVKVSTKRGVK